MKPIIFSTEMARAIPDGRKTMTRRVIKGLPENQDGCELGIIKRSDGTLTGYGFEKMLYNTGDILWVRETWRERFGMSYANYGCGSAYPVDDVHEIEFKAGGFVTCVGGMTFCPDECTIKMSEEWSKWHSPRYMLRIAARIFLKVTNIRVERLQEITEEDAEAEGVEPIRDVLENIYFQDGYSIGYRLAFEDVWNSINAKHGYGWDVNPWVWVIEFERTEKP
jgi:hypothetical protein